MWHPTARGGQGKGILVGCQVYCSDPPRSRCQDEVRIKSKGWGTSDHDAGLTSGEGSVGRESLRWQHSSKKVLARLLGCPSAKVTIGGVLCLAGMVLH